MIDPSKVTKYDRTEAELQEFLLFCVMVAGKQAKIESGKLEAFLSEGLAGVTPFDYVRSLIFDGELEEKLQEHRIAPYGMRIKSFKAIVDISDLSKVTMEQLVLLPGVSYKTANFFLTHSRENHSFPILDTHILKWLGERGYKVPKSSPSNFKKYAQIAKYFIDESNKLGKDIATLDLEIWNERSTSNG